MYSDNNAQYIKDYYFSQINVENSPFDLDNISEDIYDVFQRDNNNIEDNNLYFNPVSSPTNLNNLFNESKEEDLELEKNYVYPKTIINIDEEKEESVGHKKTIKTNKTTTEDGKEICYTFDKISEIISVLHLPVEIKGKITEDEKIIEIIEKNLKTKKIPKDVKEDKKLGRKREGDDSESAHDRNSSDNIINRVKTKIIYYALSFINKILDLYLPQNKGEALLKMVTNRKRKPSINNLLKDLDHKEIKSKSKKDFNLKLLDMSFKELFFQNISPRYTSFKQDSNRIIFEQITSEEKNNDVINYALDLKIIDWLNFFTHKTELDFVETIEKEKNVKFERVEVVLNDVGCDKKNDDFYFSKYLFYLYNYKWYFEAKKGRASRKDKKNELTFEQ